LNSAWSAKYRPKTFYEIVLIDDPNLRTKIKGFFDNAFIQGNLLCHGSPGRGKTALAEALIHTIVKDKRDIFILGRSVEDIERLKRWLRYAVGQSTQKIVKIEEMDKLSPQAQTLLKDGLMEKYQHSTAFVATTNHIDKIDPALISRFNTCIDFDLLLSSSDIYDRLDKILRQESIAFEKDTLKDYTEKFHHLGLRELINDIETASVSGRLNLHRRDVTASREIPVSSSVEAETLRLAEKYNKSVLTLKEVATELGLSVRTLQRRINDPQKNTPKPLDMGSTRNKKFAIRSLVEYLANS